MDDDQCFDVESDLDTSAYSLSKESYLRGDDEDDILTEDEDILTILEVEERPAAPLPVKCKNESMDSYELSSLHIALINYLTKASRLIYLEHPEFLKNFHSETEEVFSYLSDEFITEELYDGVMPDIFSFDITDYQRAMIELLDLHPCFFRVTRGFVKVQPQEELDDDPEHRLTIELRQKKIYEEHTAIWKRFGGFIPMSIQDTESHTSAKSKNLG